MPSTPGQPCSTSDARLIGTDEPDVTDEEINAILNTDDHPMPSYEPKSEDWGRRANGRVVILDYGYGCDNEAEINAQREYYSPFPPRRAWRGHAALACRLNAPLRWPMGWLAARRTCGGLVVSGGGGSRRPIERKLLLHLVGVTGFEPATPTSRT